MKLVIAPDSFKGTFSSQTVCDVVSRAFREVFPDADIAALPLSDGGEGACAALGAKKVAARVTGPDGDVIDSFYGVLGGENFADTANSDASGEDIPTGCVKSIPDGFTAVVECAACAGLTLTRLHDPSKTTTYGMGELILTAAREGAKHIVLSLGGSATNDCGCGLAAACGVRFYGESKQTFVPTGATLKNIHRIDTTHMASELDNVSFTAMCDVTNPLCGENGAAYVFAPQKGADADCVRMLDGGMRSFAEIAARDVLTHGEPLTASDIMNMQGGGAAGGLGAAVKLFLNAPLTRGIDVVCDALDLRGKLAGADLCVTGEGKLDSQSLGGKVISGVARLCGMQNVPCVALCGAVDDESLPRNLAEHGIAAAFSIQRAAVAFADIASRGERDLYAAAKNLALLYKLSAHT